MLPGLGAKLQLILLTPFVNYPVFDSLRKGAKDAAKTLGVDVRFDGVKDGDLQALAEQVREASEQEYDGIALNLVSAQALAPVVAEAYAKGVPLIAFNVDDARQPTKRLSAVGQDMRAAGRLAGLEAMQIVPPNSRILITQHDSGIAALEERAAGIQEVLGPHGVTWSTLVTSTDRETAITRIRQMLVDNAHVRVVLSTGQADTEAAGLVLERHFADLGYRAAGFDTSREILRLVKAGILEFTIDQHMYAQGFYAVVALTLRAWYGIAPASVNTGATVIRAPDVDGVMALAKSHYR